MLDQMYTEIILEHNRNSPHKGSLESATHVERGHNPNCGDDLTLHLEVHDGKKLPRLNSQDLVVPYHRLPCLLC